MEMLQPCPLFLVLSLALWLHCVITEGEAAGRTSVCPQGHSHANSCYVFVKEPYAWFDAKVTCEAMHGKLVEIETKEENDFIVSFLKANSAINSWMGLSDIATEGTFLFTSTGLPPIFTDWRTGEPNNVDNEDCVDFEMVPPGKTWNDSPCERVNKPFICEKSISNNVIG